jgi:hypothetical protein
MFLDDLTRVLWRWWRWRQRTKRFRGWNLTSAQIKSCKIVDDILGERLNLVFRYQVNGESYWGSILSKKRRTGTTIKMEDDLLDGHTL